ncbi:TerC family protein [Vibrio sp. D404a]|uniref:TerC family protein n=1 Tax=unclassified Vibrio TaxID=2614977 RepID=UPI00255EE106|nr:MULTISPECIES: TerC family protein [unclassified Vibrio]MDK9736428.1 TerC family protein [Vibrio sp. D404a]MDK9796050.1 TerC family protein [Vibrio sp. D449a]
MSVDYIVAFGTLLLLEVILGVDNVIFISILVEELPTRLQRKVRNLGISLAVLSRIGLVFSVSWLMSLTEPLVSISRWDWSGKDIILIFGGAFLMLKSLHELYAWLTGPKVKQPRSNSSSLMLIVLQIIVIDAVFSFDSVITAVALVNDVTIIISAIVVSAIIMVLLAEAIQTTITKHPGLKLLALLFLVMLGVILMLEGVGIKLDKSYVYVVLAFGLLLEVLHIILNKQSSTTPPTPEGSAPIGSMLSMPNSVSSNDSGYIVDVDAVGDVRSHPRTKVHPYSRPLTGAQYAEELDSLWSEPVVYISTRLQPRTIDKAS